MNTRETLAQNEMADSEHEKILMCTVRYYSIHTWGPCPDNNIVTKPQQQDLQRKYAVPVILMDAMSTLG